MVWHDNDAKEWGTLESWAITSSEISYYLIINISTVQGEKTGGEAQRVWSTAGVRMGVK